MISCPDCGRAHMGTRCGMTYAQRLRTVRLDPRALPVKLAGSKTYYDKEPIRDVFGENAAEIVQDATKGLGSAHQAQDGSFWRRDRHTGEPVRVTEEEIDRVYLGGDSEEEL